MVRIAFNFFLSLHFQLFAEQQLIVIVVCILIALNSNNSIYQLSVQILPI